MPLFFKFSSRSLLATLLALLCGRVAAAESAPSSPSSALRTPYESLGSDGDAFSIEDNPALLARLSAFSLGLSGRLIADERSELAGVAAYFAKPVTLPFLTQFSYGSSISYAKLPDSESGVTEWRLAAAYAFERDLSFGAVWSHLYEDSGDDVDGLSTFDLGLAWRMSGRLALGLAVRDVTTPRVRGLPIDRRWNSELVIRPTGRSAFELALGGEFAERRSEISGYGRIALSPWDGVVFRALVESRPWTERSAMGSEESGRDLRANVGLELSFGRTAMGLSGEGTLRDGAHKNGMLGWLRFSGEKYPSIVSEPKHLVKIAFEEDLGGAERLTRLLSWLRRLETETKVAGLIVQISELDVRWGNADELRNALLRLRRANKFVFSYVVAGSTLDYYVASAADRLYLDTGGGLRLIGLSSSAMYLKTLFDQVGVRADFIKIAEFKSAPEMFTRDSGTEEARSVRRALADGIFGEVVSQIAASRNISEENVRKLIDEGLFTPPEAIKARLVDGVTTRREMEREIAKVMGKQLPVLSEDPVESDRVRWDYPQIAVIHVVGDIVDGKSSSIPLIGRTLAGGETIIAALTRARVDPQVSAIVLRIDTTGGSALASDQMEREVALARKVKPVICSFGDVAASGGYFIAAPCTKIYAMPNAITGSIGIFTGKFDLSGLAQRIGLATEYENRGARADMESMFRLYTPEERATIFTKLRYYYGRFVGAVARGRKMTIAQVDAVGRGHVWTGRQAKERGLVDEFGSVADAIADAKVRAGLSANARVSLLFLPQKESNLLGTLLSLFSAKSSVEFPWLKLVDRLSPELSLLLSGGPAGLMRAPGTPQAQLPYSLNFE